MSKLWIGDLSAGCDLCETPFGKVMYDARLTGGMWGNVCRLCFRDQNGKLGIGCGQEYHLNIKSGRYHLVKGGE